MSEKGEKLAFFPSPARALETQGVGPSTGWTDPSAPPATERPAGAAMDRINVSPRFSRLRRSVMWGVAFLLLAGAVTAYSWSTRGSIAIDRAAIGTAPVRNGLFRDYLPARGIVEPRITVFVTAFQSGQVQQVLATDGTLVVPGLPLARISNPQFDVAIASQEVEIVSRLGDISGQILSLEQARRARDQEVAGAQQALLEAEDELRKQQFLFEREIISQARLNPVRARAEYHRERVGALRQSAQSESRAASVQGGRIARAERELNDNLLTVKHSRDALILRAPTAGRLTNFRLHPGQPVAVGETVGQIDSEGSYKLVAEADEYYLGRVALGQLARATIAGRTVNLTVSKVEPQVSNGRFTVELEFEGPIPAGLRRGQSVDLQVQLGDSRPALFLPNGPWARGTGEAVLFVITANGRAERRPVEIGRSNPEQVEILRGLRLGDQVIVSDTSSLEKYQTLIIR